MRLGTFKKYLADLGQAHAPAANGDSGLIIRTWRCYNEWKPLLIPANQNYMVQSLGMVLGSPVAPMYVKCSILNQWGVDR